MVERGGRAEYQTVFTFFQNPSKPEKTASKDPKLYSFLVDHDGNGSRLLVDCYGNGRTLLVVCYEDEELNSQLAMERKNFTRSL